ncbi:MAG: hypothetical protein ACE5DX_01480 [Candidatus Dojkabacteria bacterium]
MTLFVQLERVLKDSGTITVVDSFSHLIGGSSDLSALLTSVGLELRGLEVIEGERFEASIGKQF